MWFRSLMLVTTVAIVYLGYQFLCIPSSQPLSAPSPKQTTLISPASSTIPVITKSQIPPLSESTTKNFKSGFTQPGFDINPQVLNSIESILNYADTNQIEHNHILTLIDYSIPANQKRLWVLDLNTHTVLFHTYVSHGIKSGRLETNFFSNRFDSKASSIGVYRTNKTYYGRHGLSLKLDGLDRGFNDNADPRAIVMHGGWYVEEKFIQKYGRAGRSWGCPAVPDQLTTSIINTIKDKSLFVIYYPNPEWLVKSRFLKRESDEALLKPTEPPKSITAIETEKREDVLLAQIQKKHKYQETEAILAMPAERYSSLFQNKVPLERMIRRQIEDQEYIALSKTEFDQLLNTYPRNSTTFQEICFILPEIKMIRGYYVTEMHKMNFGSITDVDLNNPTPKREGRDYTVHFAKHPALALKSTHRFIRWLGL